MLYTIATVMEVYKLFYADLIKVLPMDDITFIGQLYSQDLLPGDLKGKVKSHSTQAEKASYFLDHVIEPSLSTSDSKESFERLISVMKRYNTPAVKELASKIRGELAANCIHMQL